MDKVKELDIQLVKLDMTDINQTVIKDLGRADRSNIPVNLIYPADYPDRPAILLEESIGPGDALEALNRISANRAVDSEVRIGKLSTTIR